MNQGFSNTFNSSQFGGGFEAPSSQSGFNAGGTKRREQSVRPVTIRQLSQATQANPEVAFSIDGQELSLITVLARVIAVTEVVTHVTLKIHDHTSGMEVRMYQQQDGVDVATRRVGTAAAEGAWVRLVGLLKTFSGRRHLVAHSITPVTDYNEIVMHLYHAMATHLYMVRGPSPTSAAANNFKHESDTMGNTWDSKSNAYSTSRTEMGGYDYGSGAGSFSTSHQYSTSKQDLGNPIYNAISELLTRSDLVDTEGVHRHFLLTELNRSMPHKRVNEHELTNALEWMLNEGHVYNTIDEDTFKSTQ
jgi:replication factor A2